MWWGEGEVSPVEGRQWWPHQSLWDLSFHTLTPSLSKDVFETVDEGAQEIKGGFKALGEEKGGLKTFWKEKKSKPISEAGYEYGRLGGRLTLLGGATATSSAYTQKHTTAMPQPKHLNGCISKADRPLDNRSKWAQRKPFSMAGLKQTTLMSEERGIYTAPRLFLLQASPSKPKYPKKHKSTWCV